MIETKFLISEIFRSIQGEARPIGANAVFIRLAGCNLRCENCDTQYASYKVKKLFRLSSEELVKKIKADYPDARTIIFTGGEPLLQKDLIEEFFTFIPNQYIIYIETNGTLLPLDIVGINYNVSPKLSFMCKDAISILTLKAFINEDAIFKFLVKDNESWNEMQKIILELGILSNRVWIMPEGKKDKPIKQHALSLFPKVIEANYNLSPRIHIWMFGNKKGI